MSLVFTKKEEFCILVMERVEASDDGSYMEAILEVCELWDIEPDACGGMLTQPIKEKVKAEAIDKKFFPKVKTL